MSSSIDRRGFITGTLAGGLAAGIHQGVHVHEAIAADEDSPNNVIRVACIGIRSRGQTHISSLEKIEGVQVVAFCDIDKSVLASQAAKFEKQTGRKVKQYTDYREACNDPDIDAVSIATCNHTHTLIAITAMSAGKDAYVEKPCSHNIWEGRQLVNTARKYNRMCQHGTQGRSSPAIREAIQKLKEGVIGDVYMARGLCFKWRPSIFKTPDEAVPKGVNYDLWLGPAPNRPYSRNRYHYNWHWHWDYGNGDMGNQGVHEMDMARWGLGVGLPSRVHGAGGHYMFDDDQETPNSLVCTFEYPDENKMLVFETRHWITNHEGFLEGANNEVGVTFFGSEGFMQVKYFDYHTYLGKKREPGPTAQSSTNPFERFIAGVRSRKHDDLGVEIEDGHLSSALCHLGNISYRLKRSLEFNPETETFNSDEQANGMLTRDYREPFVVREVKV